MHAVFLTIKPFFCHDFSGTVRKNKEKSQEQKERKKWRCLGYATNLWFLFFSFEFRKRFDGLSWCIFVVVYLFAYCWLGFEIATKVGVANQSNQIKRFFLPSNNSNTRVLVVGRGNSCWSCTITIMKIILNPVLLKSNGARLSDDWTLW